MTGFVLEVLWTIKGIGAASGLIYQDDRLHIIADDSNYLYSYCIYAEQLHRTLLINATVNENIPKKDKPDFEAISLYGDSLYIFGSGSTAHRTDLVALNLQTQEIKHSKLSQRYQSLQDKFNIAQEDFNIEGALYHQDAWWLFNRGNGPKMQNGFFILGEDKESAMTYNAIRLPPINGVAAGFTDAILYQGLIYFIAAAEDVASTYLDGEVKGSMIGCMDPISRTVLWTKQISDQHKFEGICHYQSKAQEISFLLCEDNDQGAALTKIYKLSIAI